MNSKRSSAALTMAIACAAATWFASASGRTASARFPAGPPTIELPIAEKPLDDFELGRVSVVEFSVRNCGGERLVINEVDGGCGCGDPAGRTFIIPPGGESLLLVTFESLAAGPFHKTNSYTSNDPARPKFELTVTAGAL